MKEKFNRLQKNSLNGKNESLTCLYYSVNGLNAFVLKDILILTLQNSVNRTAPFQILFIHYVNMKKLDLLMELKGIIDVNRGTIWLSYSMFFAYERASILLRHWRETTIVYLLFAFTVQRPLNGARS